MASKEAKFFKLLGGRINDLRVEKGLSFRELALRCELDKAHLVHIANRGANISVSTLYKISKGLDTPLSKILDFKHE